ncbi:nucleotidyltransferase domain-containing protein [Patescibacteria group bacterium]|nr:nucleotidyltransferase domain-containing protein [Patescibacteria group bacterium]
MADEGMRKFERIDAIENDTRLVHHRFLLSEDPALREKLRILQDSFKQLQSKFPEIISLQVFGSHTKGYASPDSDFDLGLALDSNKLEAAKRTSVQVSSEVRNYLHTKLSVNKRDIALEYYELGGPESYARYEPFLLSLGNGMRPYREAIIRKLEQQPDGERVWMHIVGQLWERENLYFSAALLRERKKLYPQTLAEARAYFLPEPKQETTSDS